MCCKKDKTVKIKILSDIDSPRRESSGAACFDLRAAANVTIKAGETEIVPLGFSVEMPVDMELQIRPRSGLAVKYSITILNSPGTVDSDYRGEVCAIIHNLGKYSFQVKRGMRIAQGAFRRVDSVSVELVNSLSETERGPGGFGSTGV